MEMEGEILLSSGHRMPAVGFGTARLFETKGFEAVLTALRCGVRQLDCAKVYGNEALVGNAIKQFMEEADGVSRKELFITSKLWNDDKHPSNVEAACLLSLKRLQVEYLDLYLIHWPMQWKKNTFGGHDGTYSLKDTWEAMERLVDKGLVRSIGVSNFDVSKLEDLMSFATISPAVNQIELHPHLQQKKLVKFCQSNGILVTAWSPLAKFKKEVIKDPVVQYIAKQFSSTTPQIILAWHLRRGIAIIPRSSSPPHIRSNIEAWKTAKLLTDEDMSAIASVNRNTRVTPDYVGIFEDSSFYPWGLLGTILRFVADLLWLILPNRLDIPYVLFKYFKPNYLKPPNQAIDE